ncbi:WD repeat-containing protein 81 [Plakobranchus ocellatus]|uniref:WD repeat-containing protein 81 n=1 Tax=Plakobranchus ocellatus TaxID=259542 RepID=A0AAV4CNR0_9GAST|nr:WD repeat-containing protein 81 [Plakobranchus ocellatus]
MYDSDTSPEETAKKICGVLKIPRKSCQQLSPDRTVCLVNNDWLKSLHRGHITSLSGFDTLEACSVEKFLSRSCEDIPSPWIRISVKAVPKSDEKYEGLPGAYLQKQWACGSLYEFMSHVCKENLTNLWIQAHNTLTNTKINHGFHDETLSFTDLVRKYLCRLNPGVYIKLAVIDAEQQNHTHSDICGNSVIDRDEKFSPGSNNNGTSFGRTASFYTTADASMCHGLVPIDVVIETEEYFILVQPYFSFTLQDSVMFSPTILNTSYAKSLFIIYQLLHAMHTLHNTGLRMGDIRLSDILMDKNMWLHITSPRLGILKSKNTDLDSPGVDSASMYLTANSLEGVQPQNPLFYNHNFLQSSRQQVRGDLTNNELLLHAASEFMKAGRFKNYEISMLDQIVTAWVHRDINNFQYLMILNHLAGRKMGDPNNHPVLPWVLDFSAPDSGYRDLSKSKFRLNKGDGQLEFTYSGMSEAAGGGGHISHHVSDILSDITYYVYKARRTPKSLLCAHVRSNWVPHEYPLSMQRLQEWTPDECIPEFFIDPTIFNSIHEDLPDLEIPPWSKNSVDFIVQHLAALESDYVSKHLHHWIDLTFGCKLSGAEAIKAKNVHLHLVDNHTYLTSHGIVQLFQQPHPPRLTLPHGQHVWGHGPARLPKVTRGVLHFQLQTPGFPESYMGPQVGEISADSSEAEQVLHANIHMPRTYNPLEDLERCEALLGFKGKVLHVPPAPVTVKPAEPIQFQDEGVAEDMVTLLCLVCEMCLDSRFRMQDSHPTLWARVKMIRRAAAPDFSDIHKPFQKFVIDMFNALIIGHNKKFSFSPIFPDGSPPPNPALLIQTYSDLIPFPPYFGDLYKCLSQLEEKSREVERLKRSLIPMHEKLVKMKQLEREKVPVLEAFLWSQQDYLGAEGMGLVLPHIQELLRNEYTTVQAAWSLFDVTTKELGPAQSSKQFLPVLTALFSGELSTAKHIKLYHRSFLIQLIVRLGLKTFLAYFSTLLVEAVAGYKDFNINSRFYPEELLEELETTNDIINSSVVSPSRVYRSSVSNDNENIGIADTIDHSLRSMGSNTNDGDGDGDSDDKAQGQADFRDDNLEDEDLSDAIVDGSHVLLEDLHEVEREGGGDGDADSQSSEEAITASYNFTKRKGNKDRDSLLSGSISSADQHSIHSITMFMHENVGDSPKLSECITGAENIEDRSANASSEANVNLFKPRNNRGSITSKNSNQSEESEVHSNISNLEKNENSTMADLRLTSPNMQNASQQIVSKVKKHMDHNGSDNVNLDSIDNPSSSEINQLHSQKRLGTGSDMVRSETEDLMLNLSANASSSASGDLSGDGGAGGSPGILNIRDIAADSVKWLCHKLGPALASRFLTRNLVRMMALCYLGQEQMQLVDRKEDLTIKTSRLVVGDRNSKKVLECIAFTTVLYGEQVVLIQCMPTIIDMIVLAHKRLSPRSEAGLVAAIVLLTFVLPYLTDTSLMNMIEEYIIQNSIDPVLELVGNPKVCFPGGALSRFVLCHKLIDLLYTLGLRLGLEMTRKFLTRSMEKLFQIFSKVHGRAAESKGSNVPRPGRQSISPSGPVDCSSSPLEVGSPNSDESYLNIKLDHLTHQYTFGSPIDLNSKSPPKNSVPKMHSLSTLGLTDEKDDYIESKSSISAEKGSQELSMVFSAELAQACYIPLCQVFGSIHMEKELPNEDLIRQLCTQHDSESDGLSKEESKLPVDLASQETDNLLSPESEEGDFHHSAVCGNIGKNVAVVGNRIHLHDETITNHTQTDGRDFGRGYRHSGLLEINLDDLRSADMDQNKSRHLRGNWLAYWERELGLHERDTMFNFMQIELQTYTGHTSSIRSLYTMDTENCFISASKDKTVRLWSIDSQGDGLTKQACQFCYSRHKKSVFSVAYVESCRLVASCDSTVHIWDPFTGMAINQLESAKYSPVVAVTALSAPSRLVAMATTDATLRFLDMRTAKYVHEFRCSLNNTGLIRCVAVSPDNRWIAAGFSTGLIFVLDVNSGVLLHHWKAHDGEILQMRAYGETRLLSSAFDQTVRLWIVETGMECSPSKPQMEPAHCLAVYRDQLLTATTANRVSVYASATDNGTKCFVIYREIVESYGEHAMSMTHVYQWCSWFKGSRTSLQDEPRSGRPNTANNYWNTA